MWVEVPDDKLFGDVFQVLLKFGLLLGKELGFVGFMVAFKMLASKLIQFAEKIQTDKI